MPTWMQDEEKGRVIVLTRNKFEGGMVSSEELLRTKMGLEILEAQVAAAISAIVAMISTAIAVFGHH